MCAGRGQHVEMPGNDLEIELLPGEDEEGLGHPVGILQQEMYLRHGRPAGKYDKLRKQHVTAR